MASSNQLQLVLACIAAAALMSVASAGSTERFTFTLYTPAVKADINKIIWTAKGNLEGEVDEANVTKTSDPNSELYARIGGLGSDVVWSTEFLTDTVSFIKFLDIGERGGRFAGSVLLFRSQFKINSDNRLLPLQTGAIVGGSKGLAGAYGNITLTFTEIAGAEEGCFRVDGLFFIDN